MRVYRAFARSLAFNTLLNTHRNSVQRNQKGLLSSCGLQPKQLEEGAHLHSYRWEAEFASDLWESTCWALDASCWEVEGSSASRLGQDESVDGPCSPGIPVLVYRYEDIMLEGKMSVKRKLSLILRAPLLRIPIPFSLRGAYRAAPTSTGLSPPLPPSQQT